MPRWSPGISATGSKAINGVEAGCFERGGGQIQRDRALTQQMIAKPGMWIVCNPTWSKAAYESCLSIEFDQTFDDHYTSERTPLCMYLGQMHPHCDRIRLTNFVELANYWRAARSGRPRPC